MRPPTTTCTDSKKWIAHNDWLAATQKKLPSTSYYIVPATHMNAGQSSEDGVASPPKLLKLLSSPKLLELLTDFIEATRQFKLDPKQDLVSNTQ
jgi:hypothetical protein